MVDFQSRDARRSRSSDDRSSRSEDGGGDSDDSEVGPTVTSGRAALVAVSRRRSARDDETTAAVASALEADSYEVVTREFLNTTHDAVQSTVDTLVNRDDVDVVVTTGATGVAARDVTVDAVKPLLDRELPGFGEQFRRRYAERVGTDAVATRAAAGIAETTPVFCLPGDVEAARLGTEELVVDQARRLANLATGDRASDP